MKILEALQYVIKQSFSSALSLVTKNSPNCLNFVLTHIVHRSFDKNMNEISMKILRALPRMFLSSDNIDFTLRLLVFSVKIFQFDVWFIKNLIIPVKNSTAMVRFFMNQTLSMKLLRISNLSAMLITRSLLTLWKAFENVVNYSLSGYWPMEIIPRSTISRNIVELRDYAISQLSGHNWYIHETVSHY